MAGPWEDYQPASKDSAPGPWQDYAYSGPGRGGRKVTPEQVKAAGANTPTDTSFGMPRFATGVDQLTNLGGNRPGQKLKGVHNAVTGAAEISAPMAVVPLVANPVGAVAGAGGGILGGVAGKIGASAAGASEDVSDLAGDVGALAGGYAGEALGSKSKWLTSLAEKLRLRKAPIEAKTWTPNKPTAKPNMPKYGGAAGDEIGRPGRQVGMRRKVDMSTPSRVQPSPKGAASLPEPKTKAPTGSTAPVNASAKPMPGQPVPEASEAGEAIQAQILGKVLRQAKIRPDDAAKIKPEEWAVIAKQAKIGAPSEKVARLALEENRKLWAASQKDLEARRAAHFAKNPK